MLHGNIFNLRGYVKDPEKELFENLFKKGNCKIERIVSSGHSTPPDQWYDQELDEWVILLQGNARIEFLNSETTSLKSGDYLFIPAHKKHRVVFTSTEPLCIWLAVFA